MEMRLIEYSTAIKNQVAELYLSGRLIAQPVKDPEFHP
jgi:hypothetical protein